MNFIMMIVKIVSSNKLKRNNEFKFKNDFYFYKNKNLFIFNIIQI